MPKEDLIVKSDTCAFESGKRGNVDLCCRLLRTRRRTVQGRVLHLTAKVQELQQTLARAREELAKEVHHFKLLDRQLALEDGRRQAVVVTPPKRKPRQAASVEPSKADLGKLLSSMPEVERNKLLATLLERLKEV